MSAVIEIHDVPDRSQYEITVDGARVGCAHYVLRGGRRYFVHTEIEEAHEGEGLGSVLAARALDAARASGEPVVPLCPFISGYIERRPEYADLVDRPLYDAMTSR